MNKNPRWSIGTFLPTLLAFPALLALASLFPLTSPAQTPSAAPSPTSPSPTSSSPAAASTPRELRDLPYLPGGTQRQRLDLYLPAADGKDHPLLVWVHGGGWEVGNRYPCPARGLTAQGYAVASIGYRFSQDAIFPAQIQDCKAALRWLRAHATEYQLDAARVGVSGESAGGHLVALLGTTGHTRQFDVGENLDQSSAVQCVIDLYGPSDFLHWGQSAPDTSLDNPKSALAKLVGGKILTHQEAARAASPINYVDKDAAPFLIFQGDKDPLVPMQQSQVLDAALVKAGVESTLKIIPGAGHGGPPFVQPETSSSWPISWKKHLRPAQTSPAP